MPTNNKKQNQDNIIALAAENIIRMDVIFSWGMPYTLPHDLLKPVIA